MSYRLCLSKNPQVSLLFLGFLCMTAFSYHMRGCLHLSQESEKESPRVPPSHFCLFETDSIYDLGQARAYYLAQASLKLETLLPQLFKNCYHKHIPPLPSESTPWSLSYSLMNWFLCSGFCSTSCTWLWRLCTRIVRVTRPSGERCDRPSELSWVGPEVPW